MKKTDTTRRSLILGASGAVLCHAVPSYADTLPTFRVSMWSVERGYYQPYDFDRTTINNILFASVIAALQKIDNYITNHYGAFGYHPVVRDTIARSVTSVYIYDSINKYLDGGKVLNASDTASQLGTSMNAMFITIAQELLQLKLRRSGFGEQEAKYLAFALAWTEIGVFGLLISNYVHDALFRTKKITPRNHTSDTPVNHDYRDELRRRQLLELPDTLGRFVFNPNITRRTTSGGHTILVATGTTFGFGESYPFQIEQSFYSNGTPYTYYRVYWKKDAAGGWRFERGVNNL